MKGFVFDSRAPSGRSVVTGQLLKLGLVSYSRSIFVRFIEYLLTAWQQWIIMMLQQIILKKINNDLQASNNKPI